MPLEVYVSKFAHMRFEPAGLTNDADIRTAKSIVDYIFRECVLVPAFLHEALESVDVDRVRVDAQDVAGRLRDEHPVREHLAQPRDVYLQARDGRLGRALAPELVDEAVARNDLVRVQEEHGEEGALFRAAERHGAADLSNFEWPEQPQLNV